MRNFFLSLTILIWLAAGGYFGVGAWIGSKIEERVHAMEQTSAVSGPSPNEAGTDKEGDTRSATTVSGEGGGEGAPYTYQGNEYDSLEEVFQAREIAEYAASFPFLAKAKSYLLPLIAALSFGCLGGVGSVLGRCVVHRVALCDQAVLGTPVFSAMIGAMLFFLLLLIPEALFASRGPIRIESLAALSFFGGLFAEDTFGWVQVQIKKKVFASSDGEKQ
jgi:hypothetical protein